MEGVRPQQPGIRLFLGLPGRLHRQLFALLLLGRPEPARPLAQRRGDSRRREVLRRRDAARSRRVHPAGRRRPALLPSTGPSIYPTIRCSRRRNGWTTTPTCPPRGACTRPSSPRSTTTWAGCAHSCANGGWKRTPSSSSSRTTATAPKSAPSAEAVTAATTGAASSRSSRAASACRPSSPGPDICRRARRATRRP